MQGRRDLGVAEGSELAPVERCYPIGGPTSLQTSQRRYDTPSVLGLVEGLETELLHVRLARSGLHL